MSKSLGAVTSILLGVAGGIAAAVYLETESGQKLKKKVVDFVQDYQENHEEINADLLNKATDLKDQVVEKYDSLKEQLETGELTVGDLVQSGKEKVQSLAELIKEKVVTVEVGEDGETVLLLGPGYGEEILEELAEEVADQDPEEDIVIDL